MNAIEEMKVKRLILKIDRQSLKYYRQNPSAARDDRYCHAALDFHNYFVYFNDEANRFKSFNVYDDKPRPVAKIFKYVKKIREISRSSRFNIYVADWGIDLDFDCRTHKFEWYDGTNWNEMKYF